MLLLNENELRRSLTFYFRQITVIAPRGVQASFRALIDEFQSNFLTNMAETLESSRHEIESSVDRSITSLERNIHSYFDRQLTAVSSRPPSNLRQDSENVEPTHIHGGIIGRGTGHPRRDPLVQTGGNEAVSPALLPVGNRLQIPLSSRQRCQCKCHSTTEGSVSRWERSWLQHFLGALGISYVGFTFTPSNDSDKERQCHTCRGHQRCQSKYIRVLIQYHFPNWLSRTILSIYFSRHDRPELLIRIHRLVDPNSGPYSQNIHSIIYANDIRQLKTILSSCPSTVHDLTSDYQESPLTSAVHDINTTAVELLLQAGADPLQRNENGSSPSGVALMMSFAMAGNPCAAIHKIAAIMPISDFLDHEDFSDLHRIMIGWLPLDLQRALIKPSFRAHIGRKTTSGLTPLHLAARCCTTGNEVQLLLDAGEDPNAVAHASGGATPLSWACQGGNQAGVQALLAAGASPEFSRSQDRLHETLLHKTIYSASSTVDLLEFLLQPQFGLDINIPNSYGMTAVMMAIANHDLIKLRYLVAKGADMDIGDDVGDTALHYAITFKFLDGIRLLLGLDCELRLVNGVKERYCQIDDIPGFGILHFLAIYGDREMMDIFQTVNMVGLPDPNTFADVEGKTAFDLFNSRVGFEVGVGFGPERSSENNSPDGVDYEIEELVQAWKDLLRSVDRNVEETMEGDSTRSTVVLDRDERTAADSEENSDDEFFDALES